MKTYLPIVACLFCCLTVRGQLINIKHTSRDSSYITDFYSRHLILRIYECTKFNNFKLIDRHDKFVFKPNRHNDIGVGFNYKALSLNLEFKIPVTQKDINIYGVTHSFDVQTYVYVRHFVIDLYAQFYHGYYLSDGDDLLNTRHPNQVQTRPDIRTKDVSLSFEYVFNDSKFSFNAPFFQNEIQKKSAGSFLAGGGIYYNNAKADSPFVPSSVINTGFFNGHRFNTMSNTAIGLNAGYAYTRVIEKHFFVMAALCAGPGIGYSSIKSNTPDEKNGALGIEYNGTAKLAAGWSSDKYFIGVTYIRLITETRSVAPHCWEEENTGNFRFIVARRFPLKKSFIPQSGIIKIE